MWRHKSKVNDYYTTNDIEGNSNTNSKIKKFILYYLLKGFNNKLKRLLQNKRKNMTDICDFLEKLAILQKNESLLALRCSGDYMVSQFFNRYRTRPEVWCQLSIEHQENRIKNFFKSKCHEVLNDDEKNLTKNYKPKRKY